MCFMRSFFSAPLYLTLFMVVFCLQCFSSSASADENQRKTSVLIFPIRFTGVNLSEFQKIDVRGYLGTRLTMAGVYKVMPESQIRKDLGEAKVESYKDCYDEACRIDLTKTVMADKSLSVFVVAESQGCRTTANLYDIAQEVTENAADVITRCDFDSIKAAMVDAAYQLSGVSRPASPSVLTDYKGKGLRTGGYVSLFSGAALVAMGGVFQWQMGLAKTRYENGNTAEIDRYQSWKSGAIVGYVVGGTGIAAGIALFIADAVLRSRSANDRGSIPVGVSISPVPYGAAAQFVFNW